MFADDADRHYFLKLLARYQRRFDLRLYHYCPMGNHFHLVLQLADARQLSRLMAGLLLAYVRYVQRRSGFVGHLWQGRFKSPAIEAETYLLSCGRYVERNPVEARLVEVPWEYAWSSARHYAGGTADPLLAANPWYEQLAATPARRQELWRAFLQGADDRAAVFQRAEWIIGEEGLRRAWVRERSRPVPRRGGRPRQSRCDAEPVST